jgi:hypothetical protein
LTHNKCLADLPRTDEDRNKWFADFICQLFVNNTINFHGYNFKPSLGNCKGFSGSQLKWQCQEIAESFLFRGGSIGGLFLLVKGYWAAENRSGGAAFGSVAALLKTQLTNNCLL